VIRFLLDTNVISETVRAEPAPALLRWLDQRLDEELFIASLTLAEIERGILLAPSGRRRDALVDWFHGASGPPRFFAGRVLPFDAAAAAHWARLMAEGRAGGRPRPPLDMVIAATALAHGCRIATANLRDFEGLDALNPLKDGAG